ncbi:LysM peptidoglycan-binding domain-containing protein [Stenotrophomonas sp. SAM-B]|jgi:nucleoid-associated protein YgaU|uniref:LysM peptidoglycan-binding domain-containing protein n=1 Tax=unclassified Stenotrophomonas TaxID=196198 RepID=UPI0015A2408C|nr:MULTISPECIES: LysM peptidoglycan-binding domain-containing protein [unclassified Stenotrophomonas]MDX3937126.1 LysM peptidoglycan-binding domain-containing protein [Stenotrophomonas sp.]NWF31696.1 LysM peptidoglycan-binding domain-containing protein [Stenotrophomonas sp. SAM-B]NYF36219.1 nucleoid-associated protein YgaU [Stenotrophomonas sp. JAI102]
MSTDKKVDFSGVSASVDTTAQKVDQVDFSGVTASVDTTAEKVGGTYTVQKGDSLSKIAKQELGDGNAWKRIFEANRDVLDDPDKIQPGQILKLPPKA